MPQGIHDGQFFDDDAAPRQALHGHRQRQRRSRRQTFRHDGHDQADRQDQRFEYRHIQIERADHKDDRAQPDRDHRDPARQALHLLLHGAGCIDDGLSEVGDAAKLRQHAGGVHYRPTGPRHDRGSRENEVGSFDVGQSVT